MTPSWTPPDAEIVNLKEAAVRLGISPDATRKRLERGTLHGEKRGNRWRVYLRPDAVAGNDEDAELPLLDAIQDTVDAARTPPDATPDIAPLTDLVADLTRRNEDLSAAAAVWQYRAIRAEERLAVLEAGPIAAPTEDAPVREIQAPQNDVAPAGAPTTLMDRLRRLLGR